MTRAISFAWTTTALLAGRKTVTRRDWKESYARQFKKGQVCAAWDKQPRFRGARHVANIVLTERPYLQSTADVPESDWEAEGFAYLQPLGVGVDGMRPDVLWRAWHLLPRDMWVVRFELLGLVNVVQMGHTPVSARELEELG